MSQRARMGLLVARYGSYLLLFVSYALGRQQLPSDRLLLLSAFLIGLAGIASLIRRARDHRLVAALIGVELALTFFVGTVNPHGAFFLLYFILVVDVFLHFPTPSAITLTAVACGMLGINFAAVMRPWSQGYLETMGSLALGFVFTGAAVYFAVEQRKAREQSEGVLKQLEAAHTRLQAYAVEVETLSVARERQRIAQEVHDEVAHVLTGLLVQIQAIERVMQTDPAAAAVRLATIEEAARRGLDEVRRAVRAMRPEHLEGVGGVEAMRRLCEQYGERTGIRVNFVPDAQAQLTPLQEVLFYRTLQECLTNATRHGHASTVWAHLTGTGDRTELRVKDDGIGAADVRPGMGIGGMQARAGAAGGRFSVSTAPNAGFEAVLELPAAAPAPLA